MNTRDQARRAYEIGRLTRAARWLVPVISMTALAAWLGVAVAVPVGGALALFVFGLRWLGGPGAAGVAPGLFAGALAAAVPLVWMGAGACHGNCGGMCLLHCATGGIASGAALLSWLGRSRAPMETTLAAMMVGSLTATLGCVTPGLIGLSGVLALAALTAPAMVLRRYAA